MARVPALLVWLCGWPLGGIPGGVTIAGTVMKEMVRSSTARPWSLPASLMSSQRKKISSPGNTRMLVNTVAGKTCRLAAALPSRAAAVAPTVGELKLRALKETQALAPEASELGMGLLLMK